MKKNGSSSGRGNWWSRFSAYNSGGILSAENASQAIFFSGIFFKKTEVEAMFLKRTGED